MGKYLTRQFITRGNGSCVRKCFVTSLVPLRPWEPTFGTAMGDVPDSSLILVLRFECYTTWHNILRATLPHLG
jgi:hypothetical protein